LWERLETARNENFFRAEGLTLVVKAIRDLILMELLSQKYLRMLLVFAIQDFDISVVKTTSV
jgi:hypothetical protein